MPNHRRGKTGLGSERRRRKKASRHLGSRIPQDVLRVELRLKANYPETNLGNPRNPLDDLIYLILSGQTNESHYQSSFQNLKRAFPEWSQASRARVSSITRAIGHAGLGSQKAGYIKQILKCLLRDFGRPSLRKLQGMDTDEAEAYLTSLPGVGIKTARCVLMYTLGRNVFPADVNCLRIMERLGWLYWGGRRAETLADLAQELVPSRLRRSLHVSMVQHGRHVCRPRSPLCSKCCLLDLCRYARKRRRARPTVVDLCCGAGGFSWGFVQAGADIVLGVDESRYALATFSESIAGAATAVADVCNERDWKAIQALLRGRQPSIVIAGPPCQGFSRAGPRLGVDGRNDVYVAAMRLAVRLGPEVIAFENVLNLRSPRYIAYLEKAMRVARRAGYSCSYGVLRAEAFGVPQSRQRIVLLASKSSDLDELHAVLEDLARRDAVADMSVRKSLKGLPISAGPRARVANHLPMRHSARVVAKIKRIKPGEGPLSYRKLHPDRLAPTLICGHRALPAHFSTPRTITVREAARLQGFPDEFAFAGTKGSQMQQVADAVPPRLALGLALEVLKLAGFRHDATVHSLLEGLLGRMTYPMPGV